MTQRILVIDDDSDTCTLLETSLTRFGYAVDVALSAEDGLARFATTPYALVLTDLALPESSGLDLCQQLLVVAPSVPVIVVTGDSTMQSAIEALRHNAFDYLTKPIDSQLLGLSVARAMHRSRLTQELELLRGNVGETKGATLLGNSAPMRSVRDMIARVAPSEATVLIQGETGTGKELVARATHAQSGRHEGPFVAINCAAVPASLLEAELFGHVKGSFTDAKSSRDGLFVKAHGGTLFLDEIGDMPLEMQAKLLRALQERVVRPVGSNTEVPLNVRVIAATHQDLDAAVKQRRFREDLFYRINVVSIQIPALRARGGDILALAAGFLRAACERDGRPAVSISQPVAERLLAHEWPGNVRELENCMERVAAVARYQAATLADLPDHLRDAPPNPFAANVANDDGIVTLEELERRHIMKVLARLNGNKSRSAELLGLDRRTLYRKLDAYQRAETNAASSAQ
ncbi:MAG TPA: sigma-54 dependent transcriptional regulator [Polyangiales bacterium]